MPPCRRRRKKSGDVSPVAIAGIERERDRHRECVTGEGGVDGSRPVTISNERFLTDFSL